jgi:hypothetical protein
MNTDTTIPSLLMPTDFDLKPKKPSKSHPIMNILAGSVVLLLVFILFKR